MSLFQKRLAAFFLAVASVMGFGLATAGTASAANTYYYSGPVNCYFQGPSLVSNYAPVRLVVEKAGTWNHAYRFQFGKDAGGSNSEVIVQGTIREHDSKKNYIGSWFTQNFPSVTSGASQALGSGYSPYVPSTSYYYATVQLTNKNGYICTAEFAFKS